MALKIICGLIILALVGLFVYSVRIGEPWYGAHYLGKRGKV